MWPSRVCTIALVLVATLLLFSFANMCNKLSCSPPCMFELEKNIWKSRRVCAENLSFCCDFRFCVYMQKESCTISAMNSTLLSIKAKMCTCESCVLSIDRKVLECKLKLRSREIANVCCVVYACAGHPKGGEELKLIFAWKVQSFSIDRLESRVTHRFIKSIRLMALVSRHQSTLNRGLGKFDVNAMIRGQQQQQSGEPSSVFGKKVIKRAQTSNWKCMWKKNVFNVQCKLAPTRRLIYSSRPRVRVCHCRFCFSQSNAHFASTEHLK